jgi:hypothetical protein
MRARLDEEPVAVGEESAHGSNSTGRRKFWNQWSASSSAVSTQRACTVE